MPKLTEMRWFLVGKGGYNWVYRNQESTLVLKIPIEKSMGRGIPPSELSSRLVRLWNNEINPHLYPKAEVVETSYGQGSIVPFIKGKQASDEEIVDALLDIYKHTGRIVMDSQAKGNFIKRDEDGLVVCVDISLALQLEKKGERKTSVTSLDVWYKEQAFFERRNESIEEIFPLKHSESIATSRALIFLKHNRPELRDVNFLKKNTLLRNELAKTHAIIFSPDYNQEDKKEVVKRSLEHLDNFLSLSEPFEGERELASISPAPLPSNSSCSKQKAQEERYNKGESSDEDEENENSLEVNLHILPEEHLDKIKQLCVKELTRFKGVFQQNHRSLTFFEMKKRGLPVEFDYLTVLIHNIREVERSSEIIEKLQDFKDTHSMQLSAPCLESLNTCLKIIEAIKANQEPEPPSTPFTYRSLN